MDGLPEETPIDAWDNSAVTSTAFDPADPPQPAGMTRRGQAGSPDPSADRIASGCRAIDEQAWNTARLALPVQQPAWRIWNYREPEVVLGRSQARLSEAHRAAGSAAAAPMGLVMRDSGGGAVLVGPWMLGVSVALPPTHPLVREGPVPSYRWLGEALAQVLRDLGIAAQALAPARIDPFRAAVPAPAATSWACFAGVSPWEAVVGRCKITGLAQVRRRTGVLLVAGVLLDRPDWELLCLALGRPPEEAALLDRATTSCAQQMQRPPDRTAIAVATAQAIGAALD